MLEVLDVTRAVVALAGFTVAFVLMWRARRWLGRFSEPAYLHISAAFLAIAAAMNGLDHIGDGLTRFTFFNVGGIVMAWIFVARTPAEKTHSWKERRDDPPDWNSFRS